ncbi:purine phosphorylase [Acanthamoeba polyphaga mimivirus]|uniref:Purine phosphorylase n=1 Tax=Acanthamoeba polyphaga mimivirus TaxID=212035 RepID=A0A2L2DKF0_MIMIV|nr:purine phosphorylase [Acanthamoeba polyphaga mimivirus]
MQKPYITPQKLLGESHLPIDVDLAFICYCPMPIVFEDYKLNIELNNRLFIHTHNSHVLFGKYDEMTFIVVAEVYGGPVSVTTVEELKHYGINTIIGIGFVGSFNPAIKTGSTIMASKSLIELGTTPHYYANRGYYTFPHYELSTILKMPETCVWTTNALYREHKTDILNAIKSNCHVVNMDTSHLYASCEMLNIKCVYYAVVSDYMSIEESEEITNSEEWSNELTKAVNGSKSIVIQSQTQLIQSLLDSFERHILKKKMDFLNSLPYEIETISNPEVPFPSTSTNFDKIVGINITIKKN